MMSTSESLPSVAGEGACDGGEGWLLSTLTLSSSLWAWCPLALPTGLFPPLNVKGAVEWDMLACPEASPSHLHLPKGVHRVLVGEFPHHHQIEVAALQLRKGEAATPLI